MPFLIALSAFAVIFLVLLSVILVRAVLFKPKAAEVPQAEAVFVNAEKATVDLAEMIKCRTVSDKNPENEDEGEFIKFKTLLPTLFPRVYEECEYIEIGDRAILFRWSGKFHATPTVLMAHYDVVSANEENWDKPAFSGIIENGVLWGRGTLDTKGTLNGILQAAETLISDGFIPESDVYFAFGGDEEIAGHGASGVVNYFREHGITPGLVCDEGGAVVEGIFPGVKKPAALIGIAEKGMLNIEYSVKGGGGHSSAPKPNAPVERLAAACVSTLKKPFKFTLSPATMALFDNLGRHSTFIYRILFANLWLFAPILDLYTRRVGGEINALVRTTLAFTQMQGSKGVNVIPPSAKIAVNLRLIPGETAETALEHLRAAVGDGGVEISETYGMNPSRISLGDCEEYEKLARAISETWQGAVVSPYLMVACSDSRHWGVISDKVYRFSAMALSNEERSYIHGNNERIPVGTITKIVEFYIRLIKKC